MVRCTLKSSWRGWLYTAEKTAAEGKNGVKEQSLGYQSGHPPINNPHFLARKRVKSEKIYFLGTQIADSCVVFVENDRSKAGKATG